MLKVVGLIERKGNYQGNDYHNVILHCTKEDSNAIGELTEVVKLRHGRLSEIFGKQTNLTDLVDLIGQTIYVYYDRFQNVQSVMLS